MNGPVVKMTETHKGSRIGNDRAKLHELALNPIDLLP